MKLNLYKLLILKILAAFLILSANVYPQISIKAVGDVMLGSVTPRKKLPPDSGKIFIRTIGKYLRNSDLLLGNLEGTFFTDDMKPAKCSDSARAAAICYEFGMPPYLSLRLKQLGFSALDMDNNHSEDYGIAGYHFTASVLKHLGIKPLEKRKNSIINLKRKKIALVPFGFSGGSNSISNLKNAAGIISALKKDNDIIIVMFHGGEEGKDAVHVQDKMEMYLNEERGNEIEFAKTVIDAGADLVIGSGPHVLRALHLYKNKLIAYSMGNFLTYGNISITGVKGITAILDVVIDSSNGNFLRGKIIPVIQRGRGIPYFDSKYRAVKIINKLIREDFPSSNILLDNKGEIIRRIINIPPYLSFNYVKKVKTAIFKLSRVNLPHKPAIRINNN